MLSFFGVPHFISQLTNIQQEWDLNTLSVNADYVGHNGYVSAVTIAPDATLCASGGKDGIIVWDLSGKKVLFTLPSGDVVHDLAFSPNRYWLCAATSASIKIYNLQSQSLMDELKPEVSSAAGGKEPECISVAWSADGQSLFSGYTDNLIRVWQVMTSS
ncbi:unnamed protein product [Kuraishia capsulata CBS 1993]|uniref:Uncharacterized protein n=1 Tax=Kuraishia capsulata CBS 1993 TaxID=1382522 RepID=W6MT80_9ASCO|nr:uncharacterized protein KUCA_T00005586001 [Kuraishia capsulata CBS 1993]CDK29593.1 unnamed protein product [Kuraishia capsulata CBS 1993]